MRSANDVVVFELDSAESLERAADVAVGEGVRGAETYAPYPIPEIDARLLARRTRLGWGVLLAGMCGCATAFFILWFCNAHDYPLDVGGRPLNSLPADIPIMFETTVLFAGITAFALVFLRSGMPRLWAPIMDVEGFERVSIDKFWIAVPRDYATERVLERMQTIGARVRRAEEGAS